MIIVYFFQCQEIIPVSSSKEIVTLYNKSKQCYFNLPKERLNDFVKYGLYKPVVIHRRGN